MVWLLGRERVHRGGVSILRQHTGQRDSRQTTAGAREEFTARGDIPMMSFRHDPISQLMYKNSLEANSMCARSTKAAARDWSIPAGTLVGSGGFVFSPCANRSAIT